VTRMFCDFCGGEMGAREPRATVTIPKVMYKALRSGREVVAEPEPETDKSEDVLSVMFGRISGGGQSKSFDGCAECVRKLVELRELVKVQLYRELAKG
jgi:hypothetical protein